MKRSTRGLHYWLYGDVRRLFVEAEGKLVGVVFQGDIVRAFALGGVPASA